MRPAPTVVPNKYTTHIRLAEVEVVAANALTEAKRAYALAESKQQVGPPGERGLQGERGKDAIGERGPKGEPGQSIKGDTGARGECGLTGAPSTVPGPKGDAGRDGRDADTSSITAALQEIRNIHDQIRRDTELNNQQRVCAMTALENKHKELVADFKVLHNEITDVRLVLKALLDQNKKGADYVAYLQALIASGNTKK